MARNSYASGDVLPVRVQVRGGAFLTCTQPGGWSCGETSLFIAGPKAVVNSVTREVEKIVDVPAPVQSFTHKRIRDPKDREEFVERDFFAFDESGIGEGIRLAIDTGILVVVPDADVEKHHPEAWANRRRHWCYDGNRRDGAPERALADLYSDAVSKARDHAAQARNEAEAAA